MNDKIAEMEMIIDELQDELRQAEKRIKELEDQLENIDHDAYERNYLYDC